MWNVLGRYCVIFSAHGIRSVVIVLYFTRVEVPCVERTLLLLCYILRAWNVLWHYCVIFSTCRRPVCGTRSNVLVLYFTRAERALV